MPEDDDDGLWLWQLWADAGHAAHGGWSWDSRDGVLVCECGDFFAVAEVVP